MTGRRTSAERQACFLRAKEAFAEKQWEQARAYALELSFSQPDDSETVSGYVPAVNANILLARIFTKTHKPAQAISQWELVQRITPDKPEPSLQLARLYRSMGDYRSALASYQRLLELDPSHQEPPRILPALTLQLLHSEAPAPDWPMRHVAIGGTSYCGSTVLAHQLGRLTGVANIGETGWLTHHRSDTGTVSIDFDRPLADSTPVCHSCGQSCAAITTDFRRSLQDNPVNWYYQIARQLKTQVLVSGDKTPVKYTELDPGLRFDLVVLFKSPLQSWYSNYRKVLEGTPGMHPQADIKDWARKWVDVYTQYLHDFENTGVTHYVYFDALCDQADWALPLLIDRLALNEHAFTDKAQHYFGGNQVLTDALRVNPEAALIKPLKPALLPQDAIDYINGNEAVQSVFSELKARCVLGLPDLSVAC